MTISVLVVDDSVVIRRLVSSVLDQDPDITVVGSAANGAIGLDKIKQLSPDLITLDIEMPVMDGLETLRNLRRTHPRLPVIMFSTLTERAASATLEALSLGANDYVTKPANVGSVSAGMESVRTQLIPKIKALCPQGRRLPAVPLPRLTRAPAPAQPSGPGPGPATPPAVTASGQAPQILAIGCSTGGPEALTTVLKSLPATFPLPIVVVQHMPPVFTAMFSQRLDKQCALRVKEAEAGDTLEPGLVLVAPGDFHMTVHRSGVKHTVALDQGPAENFCRPAVDRLFTSVASVFGGSSMAVVLTGMGHDGMLGAGKLRAYGVPVIVQDEATSVVWGMPGAIANAGFATAVLPLPQVASQVLASVAARPNPARSPSMSVSP